MDDMLRSRAELVAHANQDGHTGPVSDVLSVETKAAIASALGKCIRAQTCPPSEENNTSHSTAPAIFQIFATLLNELRNSLLLTQIRAPHFLYALIKIDQSIDCFPQEALRRRATADHPANESLFEEFVYRDLQLPSALTGAAIGFEVDKSFMHLSLMRRATQLRDESLRRELTQLLFDCFPQEAQLQDLEETALHAWRGSTLLWLQEVKNLRPDQQRKLWDSLCRENFFHETYLAMSNSQNTVCSLGMCRAVLDLALTLQIDAGPIENEVFSQVTEKELSTLDALLLVIAENAQLLRDPVLVATAELVRISVQPDHECALRHSFDFLEGLLASGFFEKHAEQLPPVGEIARISLRRASDSSRARRADMWTKSLVCRAQAAAKHWPPEPSADQEESWRRLVRQVLESSLSSPTMEGRLAVWKALEASRFLDSIPQCHGLKAAAKDVFVSVVNFALIDQRWQLNMADLSSTDSVDRAIALCPVAIAGTPFSFDLVDLATQLMGAASSIGPGMAEAVVPRDNLLKVASVLHRQWDQGHIDPTRKQEVHMTVGQLRAQAKGLQSTELSASLG